MSDMSRIATRYAEEVWNQGNLGATDEIFADGHAYHDPMMPGLPPGPEGVRTRVRAYMEAFPDARVDVHEIITCGDVVATRWTWGGTNTGPMMGGPATGRRAQIEGMHWFRFEGNRIAESWTHADNVGLLAQLGLVDLPAPQTA